MIASARASLVSGPVATTVIPSVGRVVTSRCSTVISGWVSIAFVTASENLSRSTASAPPAATAAALAAGMHTEPSRRISSLRSPAALSSLDALSELEQTSSASLSVRCAGERFAGFISISVTGTPSRAAAHAASQPAKPPPITRMPFSIVCPLSDEKEESTVSAPRLFVYAV